MADVDVCSVCLAPVAEGAEAPLDCADKHPAHARCIMDWWKSQGYLPGALTCPTCRSHAGPPVDAAGAFGVGAADPGRLALDGEMMATMMVERMRRSDRRTLVRVYVVDDRCIRCRTSFVPESGEVVTAALVVLALVAAVARCASRSAGIMLVMIMAVFVFLTWLLVTPPS
jgi:hypothetical protein